MNESAEKNLKQIVPDKQVAVIENYGILETSAIHNYKNRNENIVLFLGFVTEKKGVSICPEFQRWFYEKCQMLSLFWVEWENLKNLENL